MTTLPTTERVVEVLSDRGAQCTPRWRVGSGYLVGRDGTVLTAAHVVADAVAVAVRDGAKAEHEAVLDPAFVGAMDRCDLALLLVPDLAGRADPPPVAAVDPNAMGWQLIEHAWAVGYPRYKEVPAAAGTAPVRERAQVEGRIPPLDNVATRFLSLQVTAHPGMPSLPADGTALRHSPWQGMSGAAVSVEHRLVGVVTEHSTMRGASDITVTPLTVLADHDRAPANADAWWARLAVDRPADLPLLPDRASLHHAEAIVELRGRRHRSDFAGRDADLERLHELLAGAHGEPVVVTGLGGVGKSQLATEYAYQHRNEFRVRWTVRTTVRADTSEQAGAGGDAVGATMLTDLAALARPLGLAEADDVDLEHVAAAVRGWLAAHDDWLLLIDNADHPDAIAKIAQLVPDNPSGRTIVTSRIAGWPGGFRELRLAPLDVGDAATFLRAAIPGGGATPDGEDPVATLAEHLGGLPLALTQAAAYCRETGRAPERYLRLLATSADRLLTRTGEPGQDTVAATWALSIAEVQAASPAAAALLDVLAYFAPDVIPHSRFFTSDDDPEVDEAPGFDEDDPMAPLYRLDDDLEVDEALGLLARYNLVTLSPADDAVSVHRLLQTVVRGTHDDRQRVAFAEGALGWVFQQVPPYDLSRLRLYNSLLPHLLAVTEHAAAALEPSLITGYLLLWVGSYQRDRVQHDAAVATLHAALDIAERLLPPTDSELSYFVTALGHAYASAGRPADAIVQYQRSLDIDRARVDEDDLEVAADLNNLGKTYFELGRFDAAVDLLARALEVFDAHGADPDVLPKVLVNLGNVRLLLSRFDEALQDFERAAELARLAESGPYDLYAAENGIAGAVLGLGRPAAALPHALEALRLAEAQFDADHPDLLSPLCNLANALVQLDRPAEALTHGRRAAELAQAIFGAGHQQYFLPANNYGMALSKLGRWQEAVPYLEAAVTSGASTYGADHPTLSLPLSNLGHALTQLGRVEEAIPHLERSVRLARDAEQANPAGIMVPENNLGQALVSAGRPAEATEHLAAALSTAEQALPPGDPGLLTILNSLGRALLDDSRPQQAYPILERALSVASATRPEDDASVVWLAYSAAVAALRSGDLPQFNAYWDDAMRRAARTRTDPEERRALLCALARELIAHGALDDARRILQFRLELGAADATTSAALYDLGVRLSAAGRGTDAIPLLETVVQIDIALHGPDHVEVGTALTTLGDARASVGATAAALSDYVLALSTGVTGRAEQSAALVQRIQDTAEALDADDNAATMVASALGSARAAWGPDDDRVAALAALAGRLEVAATGAPSTAPSPPS